MSLAVREATTDDVEAVRDVARDAWYAAYGGFLDPGTVEQALGRNYDPELLESAVEYDEVAFFVAEVDDESRAVDDASTKHSVVGFASAEATWADEVELHTIYVHPDVWGEGVGSALLERVEAWAREQDVDRIACGAFTENVVGVGFLEAKGFVRGGETPVELAGERHTEYEFELEL